MSWRSKLYYANAGASFNLALLLIMVHNLLGFAFFVLAGIMWQMGDAMVLREEQKRPKDQQGE